MFNLFKRKQPAIKVIDKVYISLEAKHKGMFDQWNQDKNIVFIFWFEESLDLASQFFTELVSKPVRTLLAKEAASAQLVGGLAVFGEHHPLKSKEQELFRKLNLENPVVYSSLTEPLFKQFGSDKIIDLMKKLGMNEDESIEHTMISRSIANAQEKIEKKISVDLGARSQEGWLKNNFIS